jgi:hypothetical protein
MDKMKHAKIGFVFGAVSVLTGCVGYVEEPRQTRVYSPPPTVYVETRAVVEDDYVYYPRHQVYYSGHTHQYVYLEGRSWVTRPSPPHVSVDVLFASPSVNVDFHDAPERHHATIVQTYPRNWTPPGASHGNKDSHGEGHDQGRHEGNKKEKKGHR